uniref:SUEL-type lectin domain-containing protein n=1 Tax=Pygocentrus nattereri TaxID=42514 RepID=A0AAR2IUI7_PYGNA
MFFLKMSLLSLLIAAPGLVTSTENVITCDGNVQRLSCDIGLISVQSAVYGRTARSVCSAGRPPSQIQNTRCISSIPLIFERCDGKIACEFKTDTIGSPDPCVGTYKYYNTTYNCIQARVSMTCEGSFSTLACGNDVIQIVSADYGRTDVEICSNGQPSSLIENTDCHAPDTLTSVVEGCNEKRSCILEASNAIFTDPCVGTYKYLAVSYFCRPTQVGLLKIHIANYGRTDSTTCSLGRPFGQITKTDCFATTSLSEVATRCKDRSNCTVPATNTVFTDPCVGTYKYLSIVYSCVVNDFLFSL